MSDEPYAEPVMHRAADGILTMEWPGDERVALCARPLLEQFVEAVNENVRLQDENEDLRLKWLAWCDRGELAESNNKKAEALLRDAVDLLCGRTMDDLTTNEQAWHEAVSDHFRANNRQG